MVDAADLKSAGLTAVRVRVPSRVHFAFLAHWRNFSLHINFNAREKIF